MGLFVFVIPLAGCEVVAIGAGAAAILNYDRIKAWYEEPSDEEKEKQRRIDEVWCYRTLGAPECYPTPQAHEEYRLIGVYPPDLYPKSSRDYWTLTQRPPPDYDAERKRKSEDSGKSSSK